MKRIQGYIDDELYKRVQKKIEEKVLRSESHAVERGLELLMQDLEGKLLSK